MVKKSGKKFIPILSGIVLALSIVAIIIFKLNAKEGYRSIVVTEVSGIVSVVNNGIEYKAYEGMHLMEGYEVITSGESYVRMVLDDDKYVKLESGSRLILETLGVLGSGKTCMRLDRGSMTNEIVKPLEKQEEFIINTPNATLAVRGTFFRVNIGFTDKDEVSTDVLTYGGAVACKRVMPTGEIIEENVIIEAGFKTKINMNDVETVYALETVEKDEETGEITVKKCVPIVIDEDISDDDLVDISFAADNGHEMFIDKEVIKEKINDRGIDISDKISVYDKAEKVINSGKIEIVDDSKPLIPETTEVVEDYIHDAPFDGGHVHKRIETVLEAGCIVPGKITESCKECGEIFSETKIPATGHTQMHGGLENCHSKCSECGTIISVEHVYTQSVSVEPTCLEMGEMMHNCVCGYSYMTEIPATGHTPVNGASADGHSICESCGEVLGGIHVYTEEVILEPTCTEMGVMTRSCECGYSYTSDIPATGHTEIVGATADCHIACQICDAVISAEHTYTEKITIEADCDTDGEMLHTCECGYSYTTVIPATVHTEVYVGTVDAHSKCNVCGEVISTTHSYTDKVTIEPTCTEQGVTTHTCVCGYSYTTEIAAKGHTEIKGGTSDCHSKCSVCSAIISSSHIYTDKVTLEPTCTEKGEITHSCDCGYSYTTEIVENGHTTVNGGTADAHFKCEVCNEILSDVHTMNESEITAAGCKSDGEMLHTCDCGYKYTSVINQTGHSKEDTDVAFCDNCGLKMVKLNSNNFPDSVLLTYLTRDDIDIYGDDILDADELALITTLEVPDGVKDVTGVELLTSMSRIDLTNNTTLEDLSISGFVNDRLEIAGNASLTSINLTDSVNLKVVDLSGVASVQSITATNTSALITMDVTGLADSLTSLTINDSAMTTLDLSAMTKITNLNVTGNAKLTTLNINNLGITALDLTGLDKLQTLNARETGIVSLDVSDVSDTLKTLDMYNSELTTLTWPTNKTKVSTMNLAGTKIQELSFNNTVPYLETLTIGSDYLESFEFIAGDSSSLGNITIMPNNGLKSFIVKDDNYFISASSIDLSGCDELETVVINGCSSLMNLTLPGTTTVKSLDLTGCSSMNSVGSGDVSAIERLTIGNTDIKTIDLGEFPALKYLDASSDFGGLSGELVISGHSAIETIDLSGTEVSKVTINNTDTFLRLEASDCTKLNELNISGCVNITSLDVSSLPNLEILNINGCTGITSLDLSSANNLIRLDIGGTGITSIDLSGCGELLDFFASGSALTGDLDYTYLTNLSMIDLSNSTGVTSLDVSNISTLHYLILSGCSGVTTLNTTGCTGLWEVVINGTQISTVSMTNYTSLMSIEAAGCTKLTSIDVTGCTEFAWVVLEGCTALQSLKLNGCTKIRTLDMSGYDELNSLTYLDVRNNSNLTELYLSALTELTTVDVDMSDNLTYIDISNTKLSAFDSSAMSNVKMFMCMYATNLTSISLGNATNLSTLNVTGCSSTLNIDLSESSALYGDYANSIIGYVDTMTVN